MRAVEVTRGLCHRDEAYFHPRRAAVTIMSMTARILVGTCSWADKTLIDSGWYPPQAKTAEERLRHYARQFPIVEVDSTYYGLPSERNVALWAERTPPDFVFDVKAYGLFTHHPATVRSLPKDLREELPAPTREKSNVYYRDLPDEVRDEAWRRFGTALLSLDSAGKLGVVLFQFPPWFLPGRESRQYILAAREKLLQYTLAVEFRNHLWFSEEERERTLGFLRENAIPLACVDEPQGFRSSVPPLAEVTAPLSLVRFHGRNHETWERKGTTAAERFDYLYSEQELSGWVPSLRRLGEETREVHVLMNNCQRDYAVRNAQQMARLLGATGRSAREGQGRLL